VTKSCASTAMFQRMAKQFAASAPPGHHESTRVTTLCVLERAYATGFSQTLALLQAGDQTFTQTITGNSKYLPPSMRSVAKRGRDAVDDDEEDDDEAELEAAPKKAKGKSRSAVTTPARRTARRAHVDGLDTPQQDDDDPSPQVRPKAPRKTRARPDRHAGRAAAPAASDAMDDDDGNETETESTVASSLGVRRSARNRHASEPAAAARRIIVKAEDTEDLSSLIDGFEGIDVQSAIDAESEYGTPAPPVASTSARRSGSVHHLD